MEKAGVTSNLTLDHSQGPTGHRLYGRRNEEYLADFELVCRRSLNKEEYDVFHWHFLQGADWKYCIEKIGIDKGAFFHRLYAVQEKLGRVFRELQPYPLFPLDEYFSGIKMRKVAMMRLMPKQEEEDLTVVAKTNVIEMPRRSDKVSRNFPVRDKEEKVA